MNLKFMTALVLLGACSMLGAASPQQNAQGWQKVGAGLYKRSAHFDRRVYVEYHAYNMQGAKLLHDILQKHNPQKALILEHLYSNVPHVLRVGSGSCSANAYGEPMQANLTVTCPSGVNITGNLTLQDMTYNLPIKRQGYSAVGYLNARLTEQCPIEPGTDQCKPATGWADEWESDEEWYADDGESGYTCQAGIGMVAPSCDQQG